MVFLKRGITDKKSKKESNYIVSLLLMSATNLPLPIARLYANIVFIGESFAETIFYWSQDFLWNLISKKSLKNLFGYKI